MLQKLINELSPINAEPFLNGGASLEMIRLAEKTIDVELPEPLKKLYLEANGENYRASLHLPYPIPLFIDFVFYDLQALASAYQTELAEHRYLLDSGQLIEDISSIPKHSTVEKLFCKGWIPFAGLDGSNARYLAMDTMPGIEGVENQIIIFGRDIFPNVIRIADSLEDFLRMVLEHLNHYQAAREPERYENCFLSDIFTSYNI